MPSYKINFVKNFSKIILVSLALFVVIGVSLFTRGIQLDIQFKGGTILTYSYKGDIDTAKVVEKVNSLNLGNTTIQLADDLTSQKKSAKISMTTQGLNPDQLTQIDQVLTKNFKDNEFAQTSVNNVSPAIGKDFFAKSLVSIGAASLFMILFIAFRFKKIGGFSAGVMAVIALIHDIIIIFGTFVLLGYTIDNNFIAVILTILGYSVNDTIVIYDRVRENRQKYGKRASFADLMNLSINECLTRTINTTITTVLALSVICIIALITNVQSILTFAFPMMIGMISGVYSSICIAGPLWVKWQEKKAK